MVDSITKGKKQDLTPNCFKVKPVIIQLFRRNKGICPSFYSQPAHMVIRHFRA